MKKMTMTKLFTLAALSLMGVTMSSCGDDDEDVKVEPAVERMTLLTNDASKEWLFISQIGIDGDEYTHECQQDDIWTFKSSGEFSIQYNEICYEEQEDSKTTWSFNSDATSIVDANYEGQLYIFELTKEKLVIAYDVYDDDAKKTLLGQEKMVLHAK